jgi:hypothetical protein
MNKKIEELAKEAGLDWVLKRASVAGQTDDKESIEKFAELLIRDCAKQVNHIYKQGGGTYAEVILKNYNLKIK